MSDLADIDIDSLTDQELLELDAILEYDRTHQLYLFEPYPYQAKFMEAGLHYRQRYMRAGNRVGKTYGQAMEFASHLTGQYQEWFNGERIADGGHLYWCVGVDLDSVCRILQKELFGTSDIRNLDDAGTGAIPRSSIDFESMVKDGPRIRSCRIKHVDGQWNTLQFFGGNSHDQMMGAAVKGVWMDEEPPHTSMEIYSQCVTRTATTNGFVMFSATPEQGNTELNQMYTENKTGELYMQSVSWDDCPHLQDPKVRASLLAGIPEWQWDMRIKGEPVVGIGAVFGFKDSDISLDAPFKPDDRWMVCGGVDFGMVVDPSVIMYAATNGTDYVLFGENYMDKSEYDRSPKNMAQQILSGDMPNCTIVVPHDAGLHSEAVETKGKELKKYGVNVWSVPFKNPSDVQLNVYTPQHKSGTNVRSIEVGLQTMRTMFEAGTLKVSPECLEWFKEKAGYQYKRLNSGAFDRTGADHVIDASRYALLSLLGGIGDPYLVAKGTHVENYDDLTPSLNV